MAVRYEANLATRGRRNHADKRDVISESAGDRAVPHGLHAAQGIHQALILPLLEGLDKYLTVLFGGILINLETHVDDSPELCAGARGGCFDGFILLALGEEGKCGDDEKKYEETGTDDDLPNVWRPETSEAHVSSLEYSNTPH